ncbi:transporter [Mucilaginibacter sp. 44-25]|uniref:ZIP family metal transporter n=1 Tax=Mucilaginibacter sp. 44-25 TaxID=1895794 RepID=UPI000960B356|nr:transporter [Mucilaginibacter sp. 44-25]OJW13900.1 MAG: transporter [Mucilaginibacter sp. 44-25]
MNAGKEILFALIPVVMLTVGGIIALIRPPAAALKSVILHFAAGVVFSVVAVELLPDMIKIHDPKSIVFGFTMGITAMLLIKHFTEKLAKKESNAQESKALPWGIMTAIGIDLLLDGILLGIGFAAGAKEGVLLALALALECFSLGMATVTTLLGSSLSKKTVIFILLGLSGLFIIGALIGLMLLHGAGDKVLELILSFGSAALLFLVTEELLVEAHEEKDSPFYTAAFFGGFLIFIILGMVI